MKSYYIPRGDWPAKFEMYDLFFKSLGFIPKENADFLILPGGSDLGIRQDRDIAEARAFNKYVSSNRKVVGICRGMQLCLLDSVSTMAIHLPGIPHTLKHTTITENWQGESSWHTTNLGFITNTRHHQGFLQVHEDWEVLDFTPDGVIESVRNKCVFGVQWHPEMAEMKNTRAVDWYVATLNKHLNS